MRLFAGCLLIIACSLLFALPVTARDRQLRQTYSIELEVECLDVAMEIIRGLDGYNLESDMFVDVIWGRSPQRRATYTRRVDERVFRHIQEVLRGMGEVHFESENAHFLGAQLMDVEARLAALNQEIERLTMMMAASDSLDVLIAIDFRLSQVTWERNRLMGSRNVLISQMASPVIHILLMETPTDLPPPETPGFIRRVADSFGDSWRGTRNFASNLLVFIVRISMPLVALGIIIVPVAFVVYRVVRRRRLLPLKSETDESPEAATSPDGENTSETTTPPDVPTPNEKEGEA